MRKPFVHHAYVDGQILPRNKIVRTIERAEDVIESAAAEAVEDENRRELEQQQQT